MTQTNEISAELKRVRVVSNMLCTSHAILRDRLYRKALVLDLLILGLSTWLVAMAFVAPTIGMRLTPFGIDTSIWIGSLSVGVFFLTIVQLKTDWKGRADAHKRTLDLYAEVKRESGYLLASADFNDADCRRVLSRYDMASAVGVEIPEAEFLRLKKMHRTKVAISKHLDEHPATSIFFLRVKWWLRDNFQRGNRHG